MQRLFVSAAVLTLAFQFAGCRSDRSQEPQRVQPASREMQPAREQPREPEPVRTSKPLSEPYKPTFTTSNNPTKSSGRGEPSLDQPERPAAWILVDDHQGSFMERDGHPQLQWIIDKAVTPTPTFRVEVYEPLLGNKPTKFNYLLKALSAEGGEVTYAVSAKNGAFTLGRQYLLLNPGDDFVIRNWTTGDEVRQIAPLPPGTYVLAATVGAAGKETAAVTEFRVGEPQ
jgi:hypothetical protein